VAGTAIGAQWRETLPPPPPAHTPGKHRWIRWVAAGGVLLVLLGIVVVPRMVQAVNGTIREANAYLGLLRDGATDAAYGSLCSELRQQMTLADFAAALRTDEEQAGRLVSFNAYKSMVEDRCCATAAKRRCGAGPTASSAGSSR
jgi:hypothetical protein